MMSEYIAGDERNCRNCQRQVYFSGIHWWHLHNESTFCLKNGPSISAAEPELDETERVRAAALELLEALKLMVQNIEECADSRNQRLYPLEGSKLAKARAAIAKATSTT